MKTPVYISAASLRSEGACDEQLSLVVREWGTRRRRLTREILTRAAELGLALDWLIFSIPLFTELRRRHYPWSKTAIVRRWDAACNKLWEEALSRSETMNVAVRYYKRKQGAVRRQYLREVADLLADDLGLE